MRARDAARQAAPGTAERKLRESLTTHGNELLDRALVDQRIRDRAEMMKASAELLEIGALMAAGHKAQCPDPGLHGVHAWINPGRGTARVCMGRAPDQELTADCLEPYDHDPHVWQSKDGLRRCPGNTRTVLTEGGLE